MSQSFEGKLHEAERLTAHLLEEGHNLSSASAKGLTIYKELCMRFDLKIDQREQLFISYMTHAPNDAIDMLYRWRDMLSHLRDDTLINFETTLLRLTKCSLLSSIHRLNIIVTLHNTARFDISYDAFMEVANDSSFNINHQIEACKYLYSSEIPRYVDFTTDYLIELVNDQAYPSDYRYGVVSAFTKKVKHPFNDDEFCHFIRFILNARTMYITYQDDFAFSLLYAFFLEDKNNIRDRILSGSAILSCIEGKNDEKNEITEKLFTIAGDENMNQDTRADALDIIINNANSDDARKKAREYLAELGFSGDGGKTHRTAYSSSQNIHLEEIQRSVSVFIEKILEENIRAQSFEDVQAEVVRLIEKRKIVGRQRHLALKALNRINVDTTPFTKFRSTLAEVFIHIWARIQTKSDVEKDLLGGRLIDELIEMADTCASGHAARLVNVLATVDFDLRISWEDQINANINGRLMAKMRDMKDQDLAGDIMTGMLATADKADQIKFMTWAESEKSALFNELYSEFVGEGYIKNSEFRQYFKDGWTKFIGTIASIVEWRMDTIEEE